MLERLAPLIFIAFLSLVYVGVFVTQKIISSHDPCSPLLAEYEERPFEMGKVPDAFSTKMNLCDYLIQFSNTKRAFISHVEAAGDKCVPFYSALDDLRATFGQSVLSSVEACHAAAIDPNGGFKNNVISTRLEPQRPSSEEQPCKELFASLMQIALPDRALTAFKSRRTKKNYCDFLLGFSDSEQAIIDRFEGASLDCGALGTLKTNHAQTSERRAEACDAAAVDPDGLVTSRTR